MSIGSEEAKMKFKNIFILILCILVVFFAVNSFTTVSAEQKVVIFCYHDTGPVTANGITNYWTMTEANLERHFKYYKDNGYTPISLDQYIAFGKGEKDVPDKSILLTFDDGYLSFYTKVYPLLKKYNYPAVFAIIGTWIDGNGSNPAINWDQMREMEASGLVSIASHTYNMHHYAIMNSYGDSDSVAATRIFSNGNYESFETYRQRVQLDLQKAQQQIERELEHKAKALVWPFGNYTQTGLDIAWQEGFTTTFGLGVGKLHNSADTPLAVEAARRVIVMDNPNIKVLANNHLKDLAKSTVLLPNQRTAQVDIDNIYNPDNPNETELNIDLLIERLHQSNANTVFLQAFCDLEGDGNIKSVYFYTTHAPVKADIFSHISRRLQNEGFRVYAWMPTLAAQWLIEEDHANSVVASEPKNAGWYKRATPFSRKTRENLKAIYSDLATYSGVSGVLFQDDLYLNDYEDFSPAAKAAYRQKFGRELTPDIRNNKQLMQEWTEWKTQSLIDLTDELMAVVKQSSPYAVAFRNIYSEPVINPQSENWFAQNYQLFLKNYDGVVIMAYPYLEMEYDKPMQWLDNLTKIALQNSHGNTSKVVFKLQTYDWNERTWLSNKELKQQLSVLTRNKARHIAYYPEVLMDLSNIAFNQSRE